VPVNLKAIPASTLGEHDTFVFRKDSAGYGVPRGSLGKLNSFSNQATQHGMTTTNIYYNGPQQGQVGHSGASGGSYSGPARSISSAPSPSQSSGMQGASGMSSHAAGPAGGVSSGGAGRH
jgi:hypothetical protein